MNVRGQLHTATALLPGKESLVPIKRRVGGLQDLSLHFGVQKNPLNPPRMEQQFLYCVAYHNTDYPTLAHTMQYVLVVNISQTNCQAR
jgi:hypothetical protein